MPRMPQCRTMEVVVVVVSVAGLQNYSVSCSGWPVPQQDITSVDCHASPPCTLDKESLPSCMWRSSEIEVSYIALRWPRG